MNSQLELLQKALIADNIAAHPDFEFRYVANSKGELLVDYWGKWEEPRPSGEYEIHCFTVDHDGEYFLVKRYSLVDRKKYKTIKGAAKYINGIIKKNCDRKRAKKAKEDAEKAFAEKSIQVLRDFQGVLTENGIESKLCLTADRYTFDHLNVEAVRVKADIDITVTHNYELEMSFSYQRIRPAPGDAIDIISALARKGSI